VTIQNSLLNEKYYLNIFTEKLIVLNVQIRLGLVHSIDYRRAIYSTNLIYYDNKQFVQWEIKIKYFYRYCNCVKFPSWVEIGPFSWLPER